jgi:hypothetical protein
MSPKAFPDLDDGSGEVASVFRRKERCSWEALPVIACFEMMLPVEMAPCNTTIGLSAETTQD